MPRTLPLLTGLAMLSALPAPAQTPPAAASLVVQVEGIRPAGGVLHLALFRTARGYPEEFTAAARTTSLPAAGGALTATFEGLEPGEWALAVLHDENGNKRLDRSFVGIPREGIGASNEATRVLGVPRFSDARLSLAPGPTSIRVRMKYYL